MGYRKPLRIKNLETPGQMLSLSPSIPLFELWAPRTGVNQCVTLDNDYSL
jgi:hypothetical protein